MATDRVYPFPGASPVPIVPPLTSDMARAWSPAPNLIVLATDTEVGVYRRDGEQFVLRGKVELGPEVWSGVRDG